MTIAIVTSLTIVPRAVAQKPVSFAGALVMECPCLKEAERALKPAGPSNREIFLSRVEADEGDHVLVRNTGIRLAKSGVLRLEDAEEHFSDHIRSEPDEPKWRIYRGNARQVMRNYDGAVWDFDAYISQHPDHFLGFVNRANVHHLKGETDKGIADLDEAIRVAPEEPWPYFQRGWRALARKDHDAAIRDETEAIRLDPGFAHAYGVRAFARHAQGLEDDAIADLSKAIELDREDHDAFGLRAYIRYHQRDYAVALADFDEAVRLDPKDSRSLDIGAAIRATSPDATLRDGNRALQAATKACGLTDWREGYYVRTLAAAHAERGDFAKAAEWQERAILLQQDETERDHDRHRLELYKARTPYRLPR